MYRGICISTFLSVYFSCVFFLRLKFFKFLNFNPRIRFLYRTFAKASRDLMYFTVLFFIFFLGFAHCGYLAFSDIEEFRSFPISFLSLFSAIVGDLSYESLALSNRVFGPFFFIIFNSVVLLILINMFLAIISDAYTEVREEDAAIEAAMNAQEKATMGLAAFWEGFKKDPFWGRLANHRKDQLEDAVKMADANNDNNIDEEELINAITMRDNAAQLKRMASDGMLDRKQAEHEGKWIMRKFDKDGNAHLDAGEQKELHAFLRENTMPNRSEMMKAGAMQRQFVDMETTEAQNRGSVPNSPVANARRVTSLSGTPNVVGSIPELKFESEVAHLQRVEARLERLERMLFSVLKGDGSFPVEQLASK
jgi:Ca2+-binding EF-hand superfamily protein